MWRVVEARHTHILGWEGVVLTLRNSETGEKREFFETTPRLYEPEDLWGLDEQCGSWARMTNEWIRKAPEYDLWALYRVYDTCRDYRGIERLRKHRPDVFGPDVFG
jgi:aromatic ring hydroxylase